MPQLSQIDRTLRDMIAAEELKNRPAAKAKAGWFARKPKAEAPKTQAAKPQAPKKQPPRPAARGRRGDIIIAFLGIGLGLGCAMFPWYIFFNQEKFGIRAMEFSGGGVAPDGPIYLGSQGERIGAPITADEIPPMKLDLFATGTTAKAEEEGEQTQSVVEQPFPEPNIDFRLVFVANGRAMIADDAGVFMVQRGSMLPDNSHVAKIEQRSGKWVLVTSENRVVELTE